MVVEEVTWSARLHPLLNDYLIHEMEVNSPGKAQTLHLRAAEYFASQNCVYEAVCHAVAGARFDLAARMIEDAGAIRVRHVPAQARGKMSWSVEQPRQPYEFWCPIRLGTFRWTADRFF